MGSVFIVLSASGWTNLLHPDPFREQHVTVRLTREQLSCVRKREELRNNSLNLCFLRSETFWDCPMKSLILLLAVELLDYKMWSIEFWLRPLTPYAIRPSEYFLHLGWMDKNNFWRCQSIWQFQEKIHFITLIQPLTPNFAALCNHLRRYPKTPRFKSTGLRLCEFECWIWIWGQSQFQFLFRDAMIFRKQTEIWTTLKLEHQYLAKVWWKYGFIIQKTSTVIRFCLWQWLCDSIAAGRPFLGLLTHCYVCSDYFRTCPMPWQCPMETVPQGFLD